MSYTKTQTSTSHRLEPETFSEQLITRSSIRHPVASLADTPTTDLKARVASCAEVSGWRRWVVRQPFLRTWAGTFGVRPQEVFKPTNEEEVRWIVELARRQAKVVRCFGSLHSPSDLAMSEDYMVSLDNMKNVIKVDKDNSTIEAFAGMRLYEFSAIAATHDLALSNLGSISEQSLAGAISTATHGAGVGFGNLSTFVRSVTLVTADAAVLTVNDDRGHDLFMASLCSLGMLGVITRVEFKCEKAFNLEEEVFAVSWDYFLDNYKRIAECDEHVRMYWFPQVREVKVSRLRRTDKPVTPKPGFIKTTFTTLIHSYLHPLVLALAWYFPDVTPYHAKFMYRVVHRPPTAPQPLHAPNELPSSAGIDPPPHVPPAEPKPRLSSDPMTVKVPNPLHPSLPLLSHTTIASRVATSPEVFNYDCGPPQYTFEGVIPFDRTVEALKSLDKWLEEEGSKKGGLRPHFPIEIRPTKGDGIWLSPTYKMTGTYIGLMRYRPFGLTVSYKGLFTGFEKRVYAAGGRPHWAKGHTCSRTQLEGMFPKFADFLAIRKRLDPEGVFLNAYCRRHMLGEVGEDYDYQRFKLRGSHIATSW